MEELQAHHHQDAYHEIVVGKKLQVGDIRRKGDVYDSQDGSWAPVPEYEIGKPLGRAETLVATYVRPQTPRT